MAACHHRHRRGGRFRGGRLGDDPGRCPPRPRRNRHPHRLSVDRPAGISPAQLAEAAGLTQARISQIESGGHTSLETLRAYVTGLGGHLEVVARIGNIPLDVA
ncbi:helix-turn-helix transcriptional regulator [Micromonospora sp. NPDC050695]|uniref:helix-turn-helix domain-containing protein n=1 Tax=Micromonospora sp. NPDC050695 TaxID=3154938 RepID=UPI0033FA077F